MHIIGTRETAKGSNDGDVGGSSGETAKGSSDSDVGGSSARSNIAIPIVTHEARHTPTRGAAEPSSDDVARPQ